MDPKPFLKRLLMGVLNSGIGQCGGSIVASKVVLAKCNGSGAERVYGSNEPYRTDRTEGRKKKTY